MILFFLLVFLLPCSGKEIPDNMGKEFIFGFMEASNAKSGASSDIPLKLFITTPSQASVRVSITAPLAKNLYRGETITIIKDVIKQVILPKSLRLLGTERSNKAVQIVSSEEIVVFGINQAYKSTDGFLGIPVDVLGMQYFVPSFFSNGPDFYKSAIVITGTHDGTELSIRIKSTNGGRVHFDRKNYGNGNWLNTTIDRFETIQLLCRGDLTGTFVQSSQRVSVFGGCTVTNIGSGTSKDHIEEQIPPLNVWGKRFSILSVPGTNPNLIRVLASEDNTVVSVNNQVNQTLQHGEFYETHSNDFSFITASKPVLTVQYIPSATSRHGVGDPAMTLVPPIEQSNVLYTFLTPMSSQNRDFENTFMFMLQGSDYRGLTLDRNRLHDNYFRSVVQRNNVTSGYMRIPSGSHTIEYSSGLVPFVGILYGGANYESYAFPVGQRFTPINQDCTPSQMTVGDGLDNDCDGRADEEVCFDFVDNDGDGKYNEDCITELSTTRQTTKSTTITPKPTTTTAKPATTPYNLTTTSQKPTTTTPKTTKTVTKPSTTSIPNPKTTTTTTKPTTLGSQSTTIKDLNQKTTPTDKIDFDQIRPQWLTLTEFGVIGGVAVVLLGALGMCCKRCWGLIKNRDDDDDEEDEELRRRRRNKARLALGAPSIRPMYQ
uniref:IgGFc-binding protein-like n=1 Tax=Crassostrea virginica TaxID=6565 RepID=A0A8B8D3P8_CRAVI|nr:IgGFc-binding protein-like [Crassostrea virginica]